MTILHTELTHSTQTTMTQSPSEKSADNEFMDIIRKYRAIWNRDCWEFRHQNKKADAWQKVADEMALDVSDVNRKYETIRSKFSRYLKEIKESAASGSCLDDIVFDNKWSYLKWLAPFIKNRDLNLKKRAVERSLDSYETHTSENKENEHDEEINCPSDSEEYRPESQASIMSGGCSEQVPCRVVGAAGD